MAVILSPWLTLLVWTWCRGSVSACGGDAAVTRSLLQWAALVAAAALVIKADCWIGEARHASHRDLECEYILVASGACGYAPIILSPLLPGRYLCRCEVRAR